MLNWDALWIGAAAGLWLGSMVALPLAAEEGTTSEPVPIPAVPQAHPILNGILPPRVLPPVVPESLLPQVPDIPFSEPIAQQLHDTARAMTVKVMSGESWGSGITIDRQQQRYTIVTNAHVISSEETIRIQTPDGRVYPATSWEVDRFEGYDLAIVTFESDGTEYPIAAIADATSLQEGDAVVAVGFPVTGDPNLDAGLKFTMGRISLIPQLSLVDGYQIGYTNDVEKGMSGGPVLNDRAEVVAINGMHAYPLWGDPYIYQDGSRPCAAMYEIMERSSWGIPIQTFLQVNAQAARIPTPELITSPQTLVTLQPIQTDLSSPVAIEATPSIAVRQLQQQAERAKRCPVATQGESLRDITTGQPK